VFHVFHHNQAEDERPSGDGEFMLAFNKAKEMLLPQDIILVTYEDVTEAFLKHYMPVNFETKKRAILHTMMGNTKEGIRSFEVRLQVRAAEYNFALWLEEALRNRLLANINDNTLQKKLLALETQAFESSRAFLE